MNDLSAYFKVKNEPSNKDKDEFIVELESKVIDLKRKLMLAIKSKNHYKILSQKNNY